MKSKFERHIHLVHGVVSRLSRVSPVHASIMSSVERVCVIQQALSNEHATPEISSSPLAMADHRKPSIRHPHRLCFHHSSCIRYLDVSFVSSRCPRAMPPIRQDQIADSVNEDWWDDFLGFCFQNTFLSICTMASVTIQSRFAQIFNAPVNTGELWLEHALIFTYSRSVILNKQPRMFRMRNNISLLRRRYCCRVAGQFIKPIEISFYNILETLRFLLNLDRVNRSKLSI